MPTLRIDGGGQHREDLARQHAPGAARARGPPAASVPFSKNSSIRSSLLSATISTSFSRQASAASLHLAAGTSTAWNLPLWSSA